MTKTLTIALIDTQATLIDTALELFMARTESRLDELAKNPPLFIGALQSLAICSTLRDALEAKRDALELDLVSTAVLVTALKSFRKFSMQNLLDISEGNPRLIIGGIQSAALASELIESICKSALALADEEEAEEQAAMKKAA